MSQAQPACHKLSILAAALSFALPTPTGWAETTLSSNEQQTRETALTEARQLY